MNAPFPYKRKSEFVIDGLPEISFRKPSGYGVAQLKKIIESRDSIKVRIKETTPKSAATFPESSGSDSPNSTLYTNPAIPSDLPSSSSLTHSSLLPDVSPFPFSSDTTTQTNTATYVVDMSISSTSSCIVSLCSTTTCVTAPSSYGTSFPSSPSNSALVLSAQHNLDEIAPAALVFASSSTTPTVDLHCLTSNSHILPTPAQTTSLTSTSSPKSSQLIVGTFSPLVESSYISPSLPSSYSNVSSSLTVGNFMSRSDPVLSVQNTADQTSSLTAPSSSLSAACTTASEVSQAVKIRPRRPGQKRPELPGM